MGSGQSSAAFDQTRQDSIGYREIQTAGGLANITKGLRSFIQENFTPEDATAHGVRPTASSESMTPA